MFHYTKQEMKTLNFELRKDKDHFDDTIKSLFAEILNRK